MAINIQNIIENQLHLLDNSVWILADGSQIDYTDGPIIERRLEEILKKTTDCGSDSEELQAQIDDWPTEYYLTQKRSQLFKGFNFNSSQKVLEVGCGYGAVTRFLGETFDEVIAVEGNLNRAKIARLRTREMQNVNILCAPFQEIKFQQKFDIIFCIGVFEYSSIFVNSDKPFDAVLNYFKDLLTPSGVLVLAIENQFGLKYFSFAREDHNNIMFDGLEGYPRYNKERTFGYNEIKNLFNRHFHVVDFYFPYPDYKTPACVISEKFFSMRNVGELIGGINHNQYMNYPKPLFDEMFVLLELEKNQMLPFFANSFLIIAGQQKSLPVKMDCLGLYFNTFRAKKFHTVTKFIETSGGGVCVQKTNLQGLNKIEEGLLTLQNCNYGWENDFSLHTQIIRRAKERNITIDKLFEPCKLWLGLFKSDAVCESGNYLLDGKYFDSTWKNTYIRNGQCFFIDQEWQWKEKINLHVLLIRCIYMFLSDVSSLKDFSPVLKAANRESLIKKIAASLGIQLTKNDFKQFCRLESQFYRIIFNKNYYLTTFYIKLSLWNINILFSFLSAKKLTMRAIRKYRNTINEYI
ncbi:MAG: class I SAM-dependent methyltransferase [bacterium]